MELAKLVNKPYFTFGCDPEFFFQKDGGIIGAERVISKAGLENFDPKYGNRGNLVLDGVQVELHPTPSHCRAVMAAGIATGMKGLRDHLAKQDYKGISASFKTVIEVPEEELAALSAAAKRLGCAPSLNHYGKTSTTLESVDASKYRTRSAGGHIHIGLGLEKAHFPADRLVPLLDAIVGNTCIMLDRDPLQVERRKLYGRAGEFRMPPHGIEYRTLSNFWLRSYPLTSMVLGLVRLAGAVIYANGTWDKTYDEKLRATLDQEAIERAINENNIILARANWAKVRDFIQAYVGETVDIKRDHGLPLSPSVLDDFEYFLSKGIDHWFKEDPIKHWCKQDLRFSHTGWEAFLLKTVRKERLR